MSQFPVSYSTLSSAALQGWLTSRYDDISDSVAVQLLSLGLNDTYVIIEPDQSRRFVLRIYRVGWRSPSEIAYELDAIDHLRRAKLPVAGPVPRRDGLYTEVVAAPEGDRIAVLFAYAPGRDINETKDDSWRYGAAVAAIHEATRDLKSSHHRFVLDLDHLLKEPLCAIRPFLAQRPADLVYLERLISFLRRCVGKMESKLEVGFCHGDFHGGNAHTDDKAVTFFDFDCCGLGWRAYDIAVFRWGHGDSEEGKANWAAFLEGYRSRRSLEDDDLNAVPAFVAIRSIWHCGLLSTISPNFGCGSLDDAYWDDYFKELKTWCAKHLPNIHTDASGPE